MNSKKQVEQRTGDRITVRDIGNGSAVAAGRKASATVSQMDKQSSDLVNILAKWREQMEAKIDATAALSIDEKKDLIDQVAKIEAEATKGEQAQAVRLEKLINTLAVMSHDIFEVAIATLANPLAGIGLVLEKISEKAAKVERVS